MKITVLDKATIGEDLDLSPLDRYGDVTVYDITTAEELCERIADADVIIVNKEKINEGAFAAAKNLKLVCEFATGYDNIDVKAAKQAGVAVCNVPAYSTDSVALVTVSMALSLYTSLPTYTSFVRDGSYTKSGAPNCLVPVYHELSGKTWGIIGCGHIGERVAKVAEALGAKVVTYQRHPHAIYPTLSLEELSKVSDIISVHCPLNEGTRSLIGRHELALMKPSTILVNVARGAVLDEEAVADAILSGTIGGFGCDVYSKEPFPENHPYAAIKSRQNVILTPHMAWGAYEARERCLKIICENMDSYLAGGQKNRVD